MDGDGNRSRKKQRKFRPLPILRGLSKLSWQMLTILPQQYSATKLSKVIFYTNRLVPRSRAFLKNKSHDHGWGSKDLYQATLPDI